MKIIKSIGSTYFILPLFFNKSLEVGYQIDSKRVGGFDFYLRFNTRGDHAGLKFFFEIGSFFFEFSIHDNRHWNYQQNPWDIK